MLRIQYHTAISTSGAVKVRAAASGGQLLKRVTGLVSSGQALTVGDAPKGIARAQWDVGLRASQACVALESILILNSPESTHVEKGILVRN